MYSGGKGPKKKNEMWFTYEHTREHKLCLVLETDVRHNGSGVHSLLYAAVKPFCLCVGTRENVWVLKTALLFYIKTT